jgi:hypothetical protein
MRVNLLHVLCDTHALRSSVLDTPLLTDQLVQLDCQNTKTCMLAHSAALSDSDDSAGAGLNGGKLPI